VPATAAGWLVVREGGIEVRVRVAPRGAHEGIDGFYGDRLRVRLTAPPVGGAANDALLRLLARAARTAPGRGRIVTGLRDRSKTVLLGCDDPTAAARRLHAAVGAAVDKRGARS
jgi:uncharacterized protein YggU (UPF0235/DUF167 family)